MRCIEHITVNYRDRIRVKYKKHSFNHEHKDTVEGGQLTLGVRLAVSRHAKVFLEARHFDMFSDPKIAHDSGTGSSKGATHLPSCAQQHESVHSLRSRQRISPSQDPTIVLLAPCHRIRQTKVPFPYQSPNSKKQQLT